MTLTLHDIGEINVPDIDNTISQNEDQESFTLNSDNASLEISKLEIENSEEESKFRDNILNANDSMLKVEAEEITLLENYCELNRVGDSDNSEVYLTPTGTDGERKDDSQNTELNSEIYSVQNREDTEIICISNDEIVTEVVTSNYSCSNNSLEKSDEESSIQETVDNIPSKILESTEIDNSDGASKISSFPHSKTTEAQVFVNSFNESNDILSNNEKSDEAFDTVNTIDNGTEDHSVSCTDMEEKDSITEMPPNTEEDVNSSLVNEEMENALDIPKDVSTPDEIITEPLVTKQGIDNPEVNTQISILGLPPNNKNEIEENKVSVQLKLHDNSDSNKQEIIDIQGK